MKIALFLGVVILSLNAAAQTPTPADPAHDQKIANIRKLIKLTGGDKMANQMLDQMAASMRTTAGPDFDKFFAEFRKEFDLSKIFDMQITAYDKYLSAEDVSSLVAFYESTAGQHMVANMPQIMGDMMNGAMQMSQEIGRRIAKKLQDQKSSDQK